MPARAFSGLRANRLSGPLVAATALALIALLTGCASAETNQSAEETRQLAEAQITDYEGAPLGSIEDFRENSIKGPQRVEIADYRLDVVGEVSEPLSLTYDEVLERTNYEKLIRLDCVEGWGVDILWGGVLLSDLLEQADFDPEAKLLVFRCADGYSTSLPLDYVLERDILLASEMNRVTLPAERGFPFQVVAENKWGYKWAKWVTSIEVSNDTSFRGYWEQRGYEDDATLPSAR